MGSASISGIRNLVPAVELTQRDHVYDPYDSAFPVSASPSHQLGPCIHAETKSICINGSRNSIILGSKMKGLNYTIRNLEELSIGGLIYVERRQLYIACIDIYMCRLIHV